MELQNADSDCVVAECVKWDTGAWVTKLCSH